MKVSTKLIQNELYLYLEGELDQSVADELRDQIDKYLDKVNPSKVIFDMKKLVFMDSTGVGLIMGRYKKLRQKKVPIFISNPNTSIDKILKISGLYSIIPLLR